MVNSNKLIGITEYMTLQARCCINPCHYNWVQLHMPRADRQNFKEVHIGLVVNEVVMGQTFSKHSLSPASYQARIQTY